MKPVSETIAHALTNPQLFRIIALNARRDRWKVLVPHVETILADGEALKTVSYAVARRFIGDVDDISFCREILAKAKRIQAIGFIVVRL